MMEKGDTRHEKQHDVKERKQQGRSAHRPAERPAQESRDEAADEQSGPSKVWAFFLAFGIIFALLVGFLAYTHYRQVSAAKENQYNGFDFHPAQGGIWVVRVEVGMQPYDIPFYYHPRDTEIVLVDRTATDPILRGAPRVIYLSVDPDAGSKPVVAGVEIARLTGSKYNLLNIETHGALSRNATQKVDLPVVSCKDATPDRVVIQFVQGQRDVIARSEKNPSCIILQYTDANESIRVADRYAYMLLKIMN